MMENLAKFIYIRLSVDARSKARPSLVVSEPLCSFCIKVESDMAESDPIRNINFLSGGSKTKIITTTTIIISSLKIDTNSESS